ncbi:MAG TPA: XdhC family protein [Chloroflexota bacterium]|nr:XdhC family protein [Chloroflexota bacterium]
MKQIHEEILERLQGGQRFVIATVIRTRGSTPREVGAKMLIDPDGNQSGTIGGGCGEADVWARAQDVLQTGEPEIVEVDLLSDTDFEGGRACGGIMYVHVERAG